MARLAAFLPLKDAPSPTRTAGGPASGGWGGGRQKGCETKICCGSWYHFRVATPPILDSVLVLGSNRMFTGGYGILDLDFDPWPGSILAVGFPFKVNQPNITDAGCIFPHGRMVAFLLADDPLPRAHEAPHGRR